MKIFDSHAHYDDEKFDCDREEVLKFIQKNGVKKVISAGYNLDSSRMSIELSNKYDFIFSTCGISPNDIPDSEEEIDKQLRELEELIKSSKKIVAIGEIGLDYYWNKDNKELQKMCFIKQIELANKYSLPIVIHCREAIQDTISILKGSINPDKKGVFHCCPFNEELIKQGLKLGFYISVAGPVTYKNSKNANEIINLIPLDRILVETDCPYLSPEPKRGMRNDSSNLKYIIEKIAEQKKLSPEQIAEKTYNNTIKLFDIS